MIQFLIKKYSNKFVSRYVVLFIDTTVVLSAYFLSKIIRYNFQFNAIVWDQLQIKIPLILLVHLSCFMIMNSHKGVVRHTSLQDTIRIFKANFLAFLILIFISQTYKIYSGANVMLIPISGLAILFLLNVFILVNLRLIFKEVFAYIIGTSTPGKKNVLIYGAGQSGLITLNTIIQEGRLNYNVVGFIDDNPSKIGKTMSGIQVFSPDIALNGMLEDKRIEEVIISIQNIDQTRKSEIINTCIARDVKVKNVPPIGSWINGELSAGQIKDVRIEDLLHREQIKLDSTNVLSQIKGKTVLITGAAGSIGSEISRQVLSYVPDKIILVDNAESPLYELEHAIVQSRLNIGTSVKYIVGDVTNEMAMVRLFKQYQPEIIFHAAAYKHVPLMENNPYEAIRVNVFGTKVIADLAREFKAKKFIMISTDKAVNPTNVMGASKRIAEIYTQSLIDSSPNKTAFITTRFGNVLGSNGSVIPLFKKQIEVGGPITVTHPEITRFFMTIPEACQLVLEAGAMGKGGEIFIFDMGQSVKILDVAKNMIKLYGLKLGKDIQINFTGLRPGEKLYEELLSNAENTIPTHHPKIMIARVSNYQNEKINELLVRLKSECEQNHDFNMVRIMKEIVPEYISNNSVFEELDIKEELPQKVILADEKN